MSEHFLIVSAASSEDKDDHLMGEAALGKSVLRVIINLL